MERNLKKWIEKIPRKENLVLGIDRGTSALKWVLMKSSPEGFLFLEGGLEEPGHLKVLLEKKALLQKCPMHVAVSGQKVFLKRVLLPKMSTKEIPIALRWQIKEEIPSPVQEAYIGFEEVRTIEKEGKSLLDLLVGVAPREMIDPLLRFSSGVSSSAIETIEPSISVLGALLPPERKKRCALIDFGASSTHVGIFEEGLLEMARDIPIGGGELTRALQCEIMVGERKISLGEEEAERMKRTYGISSPEAPLVSPSDIPPEKLWILMRPLLERLFGEIKRFFEFYEKRDPSREIQEIWVTGGGSLLQGLTDLFERHLGLAPRPLSFLERFRFSEAFLKEKKEEMEKTFGAAIAVALPRKNRLNLIPKEVIATRQSLYRMRLAKGVSIALLLFLLVFQGVLIVQEMVLRRKIGEAKKSEETLLSRREEYIFWTDKKKEAEKSAETFSAFMEKQPLWEGVLKELTHLVPKEISLKTIRVELQGTIPQREKAHTFYLKGRVAGTKQSVEETLTQFLENVEESPFFKGTKLVSTEGLISEGGTSFEVTGILELESP